jgi:hypothetical protein
VDKKLVINSDEAVIIRSLFDLYLEHKSIRNLKAAAGQLGYVTKRRKSGDKITGGKPFTRGHLSQVLNNPIYIGQIAHKEKIYPGQHLAIINSDKSCLCINRPCL